MVPFGLWFIRQSKKSQYFCFMVRLLLPISHNIVSCLSLHTMDAYLLLTNRELAPK